MFGTSLRNSFLLREVSDSSVELPGLFFIPSFTKFSADCLQLRNDALPEVSCCCCFCCCVCQELLSATLGRNIGLRGAKKTVCHPSLLVLPPATSPDLRIDWSTIERNFLCDIWTLSNCLEKWRYPAIQAPSIFRLCSHEWHECTIRNFDLWNLCNIEPDLVASPINVIIPIQVWEFWAHFRNAYRNLGSIESQWTAPSTSLSSWS